jgi:hypothetical protein
MKARYGILAGIGIGYVLGAKVGRGRYHQIKEQWQAVTESPTVRRAMEPIKDVIEPVVEKVDELLESPTGTDDLPAGGLAALSADQVKERMARGGSVTEVFHSHLPEEMIKERM